MKLFYIDKCQLVFNYEYFLFLFYWTKILQKKFHLHDLMNQRCRTLQAEK